MHTELLLRLRLRYFHFETPLTFRISLEIEMLPLGATRHTAAHSVHTPQLSKASPYLPIYSRSSY